MIQKSFKVRFCIPMSYPIGEKWNLVKNGAHTFFPHKLCKKFILVFVLSTLSSDFFAQLMREEYLSSISDQVPIFTFVDMFYLVLT